MLWQNKLIFPTVTYSFCLNVEIEIFIYICQIFIYYILIQLQFMLTKKLIRFFAVDIQSHTKNINKQGIINKNLVFNPTVSDLYEIAFLREPPCDPFTKQTYVSNDGALCAHSGLKSFRQPSNSRLVLDSETEKDVNWKSGNNISINKSAYRLIQQMAVDFINHRKRCIIVDGYAGWDPQQRLKVRAFCTRSYHALYLRNILVRPTNKQIIEDFSKGADVHLFNAGEMNISKNIEGLTDTTLTALNLSEKRITIFGTQFPGEMKKAIFKLNHYFLPKKGILTLHSSATIGEKGDISLIIGLSSSGKTTLAMRSNRKVICDDEVCWSPRGVSAIEGGCSTQILNLDQKLDSQITGAIKFGTVLENVNFYPETRDVNYHDSSITLNTRASFPLEYLSNSQIPAVCLDQHPSNIILLTSDVKGVLPPLSKLSYEQAAYHFLSGYTSKVVGTDHNEFILQPAFSSCFGQTELPLHPSVYTRMFYQKLKQYKPQVWLLNAGWTKGGSTNGQKISANQLNSLINAIHSGELNNVSYKTFPYFNFEVPETCPNIQPDLLKPNLGWNSKIEYDETLSALAIDFLNNYKREHKGKIGEFESAIESGAPVV